MRKKHYRKIRGVIIENAFQNMDFQKTIIQNLEVIKEDQGDSQRFLNQINDTLNRIETVLYHINNK